MMQNGIVVRPAAPPDVAAVTRLIGALATYERLAHEFVATESAIGAALFGTPPRLQVFLAEAEGRPVGLATWFHTFETFAARPSIYLEDLYIEPGFRGRGIAQQLLATLARRAVADGCADLEWKVLDWNAPALRFYARLGAKPLEGWTTQRLSGPDLLALAASTRDPSHG